jgi:hypothetical protein
MNETELGFDAALFRGRVSIEVSKLSVIKDLLVDYPLAPSSGLGTQQINGGQMSTRGIEAGLSVVPISTRDVEWTLRTTYQHNVQYIDKLSVPPFAAPNSFGVSYGRNRIAVGTRPTLIWGNVPFSCINTTDASGKLVGTGSMASHATASIRAAAVAGSGARFNHRRREPALADVLPQHIPIQGNNVDGARRLARRRLHVGHDEESVRRGRQLARL